MKQCQPNEFEPCCGSLMRFWGWKRLPSPRFGSCGMGCFAARPCPTWARFWAWHGAGSVPARVCILLKRSGLGQGLGMGPVLRVEPSTTVDELAWLELSSGLGCEWRVTMFAASPPAVAAAVQHTYNILMHVRHEQSVPRTCSRK